jgi:hypothetical protein
LKNPGLPIDWDAVTAAIQRAVREAVLAHARAGHPVAEWRDGKVVWVQPEEILRRFGEPDAGNGGRP